MRICKIDYYITYPTGERSEHSTLYSVGHVHLGNEPTVRDFIASLGIPDYCRVSVTGWEEVKAQ